MTESALRPLGESMASPSQRSLCGSRKARGRFTWLHPVRAQPYMPSTPKSRSHALIDLGQWTHDADVRDAPPDKPGLLPFIVHKAHCQQSRNKDTTAWRAANDYHQSSPFALTGYFLDPDLFALLAQSVALPPLPLHVFCWRQASCLYFHVTLRHVLRVGQLQPLTAWRSLLYPSPARLPMVWGITNLDVVMPHQLPKGALIDTAASAPTDKQGIWVAAPP